MLNSEQIRNSFVEFFEDKGHRFVPSSPVVPADDETLLFTNAGMNQFKDIFTGRKKPDFKRVVNSQKCLRVSGKHNDLEEVGKDTYHHTFFEMLGNWSFGDYFKAEAIKWAWQLLTDVWGINPDNLWVTVFAGDEKDSISKDTEATNLWTGLTSIPAERVLAFGRKDNFWEMGVTGPCGPCSEIHIDLGAQMCDKKKLPGHKCGVNDGCGRFIELWNLVFIQYNRLEDGRLVDLDAKYIDTGAGLERLVAVLGNKSGNYDTDLFMPIINCIAAITGCKYTAAPDNTVDDAFRVISDHIRALVFSITDGVTPSNDGRGYVIRRILRRAARFGRQLGMHQPFLFELVPTVIAVMGAAFGEIKQKADYLSTVIKSEEESFGRTLDRGIEIFRAAADKATGTKQKMISGQDAFQLYDTYGFPFDLTQLMAKERSLKVDTETFDELMQQQKTRARAGRKTASADIVLAGRQLPVTKDFYKYETACCDSEIIGWIEDGIFKDSGEICEGDSAGIVLDKTCFYAEAGGQVADCGLLESGKGKFVVEATAKSADCIIHSGKMAEGTFKIGEKVTAAVSKNRGSIKKNHTATHLLQWSLQQVAGNSVAQKGSLVGPDYLRFDFTCPKALTEEQIRKAEQLVREKIRRNLPVTSVVMSRGEAEKIGAMALFGEKYGDEVRIVAVGTDDKDKITEAFSREFCGGTHVDNLGSIGGFKIIKQESISAGVRRITALTGDGLAEYLRQRSRIVDKLSGILKVPPEQITDRVQHLIENNKALAKKLKPASHQDAGDVKAQAEKLLKQAGKIGQVSVIIGTIDTASVQQGRSVIDMLKKKAKSAAIVIGFADQDRVYLLAGVTNDVIKRGLEAADIVKHIGPVVGGSGGGRPQLAQAGGKNPEKINEALEKAAEWIKEKLASA